VELVPIRVVGMRVFCAAPKLPEREAVFIEGVSVRVAVVFAVRELIPGENDIVRVLVVFAVRVLMLGEEPWKRAEFPVRAAKAGLEWLPKN